jgi:hypothetical protein
MEDYHPHLLSDEELSKITDIEFLKTRYQEIRDAYSDLDSDIAKVVEDNKNLMAEILLWKKKDDMMKRRWTDLNTAPFAYREMLNCLAGELRPFDIDLLVFSLGGGEITIDVYQRIVDNAKRVLEQAAKSR